ncbi:MAG: kstR2 5 [Candidatus Binatus sp.]|nr:kstR2 5 [Candidatus Binatus sp.]
MGSKKDTGNPASLQSNYPQGEQQVGRPAAKDRKPYDSDAILDVAVRVFRERGYDGASLEHVARAAGITKASIYYHVRSKEELLARGVGRALDALFAVIEEPEANQGRAVARLKYIVRRTIEITVDQLAEVALLLRVRGNTRTERRVVERRRQFDHLVAEMMAKAQQEKDLRGDIDPRLATRLLFGMLNSITEWYRPDGKMRAPEIAQAVFRIAFEGME